MKIVFDFSKYIDHFFLSGPTGISRVDIEFARFCAQHPEIFASGLHKRFGISTRFSRETLRNLVFSIEKNWNEDGDHGVLSLVQAWLRGEGGATRRIRRAASPKSRFIANCIKLAIRWPWHDFRTIIPKNAFYINTSYANTKVPGHFEWLKAHPDIKPVFMIHDLIPLISPELFWDQLRVEFPRQIDTILMYAKIVVTPSEVVAAQVRALATERGRMDLVVRAIPLPAGVQFSGGHSGPGSNKVPYFVICGTIEPRKNHLLLLDIWRQFASELKIIPKLIVVGQRGWKNDAVFDMLENAPELAGHVLEVSDLPTSDLASIVAGARALLMPSFDEGFGLPVVEALANGTPVIASDIPVFREVSAGCARFCDPADQPAWKAAILDLAFDPEVFSSERVKADRFPRRTWDHYFMELTELLDAETGQTVV